MHTTLNLSGSVMETINWVPKLPNEKGRRERGFSRKVEVREGLGWGGGSWESGQDLLLWLRYVENVI